MFIFVNSQAKSGKSLEQWGQIKPKLLLQYPEMKEIVTENPRQVEDFFQSKEIFKHEKFQKGPCIIASASGDGGINNLLNVLMRPEMEVERNKIILGGIGLGSSNDFFGEYKKHRFPISLSLENVKQRDIGKATLELESGEKIVKYFLLNASVGLTAQGNYFFNTNKFISWCKKKSVSLAQFFTLLYLFFPLKKQIFLEEETKQEHIWANVGILKSPYVSGNMKYDTPVTFEDGFFDLVFMGDVSRLELLVLMWRLERHKFIGHPKTEFKRKKFFSFSSAESFLVETDGEITKGVKKITVEILPKAISVCSFSGDNFL